MAELNEANAAAVADRFKGLCDPMRLRLLNALRRGERSVGDLTDATGSGQANVSKHLQVLREKGFVDYRKEGTTNWYRIVDPRVFEICELVCGGLEDALEQRRKVFRRR